MSASVHRYSCEQLAICQHRNPGCQAACHSHPIPDEAADTPPVSPDMVYLLIAVFVVLGVAVGTGVGSWLLHSFDAEIRAALAWAGEQLVRLYWAALSVHG
jgi:hypothetical protein